jgi:hypothetical protein
VINLSDVRLNNYYLFGGKEVFQVNEECFKALFTEDRKHLEMISPIPLDDEWLINKFKFKRVKDIEYYKVVHYPTKGVTFELKIEIDGIYYCSRLHNKKLEFVHELQNIFYFMMGVEVG